MVQLLLVKGRTVGELAEHSGIQSHVASKHLRCLKDRRLLGCCREGQLVLYRIAEDGLMEIMRCVESRFGMQ